MTFLKSAYGVTPETIAACPEFGKMPLPSAINTLARRGFKTASGCLKARIRRESIPLVVSVDIDGTLCVDEYNLYDERKPIQEMIDFVNWIYSLGHQVHICTSRKIGAKEVTAEWLARHRVKYHALIMEKPTADIYIDNRAMRPDEIELLRPKIAAEKEADIPKGSTECRNAMYRRGYAEKEAAQASA